ncbi:division plane positioning ATPase MipZ [Qipengyuania sp. DSG2-2]|uniref:division plane positioning ATPase MipZ n=1 Tax=Qipengyuania sp. DGS2-2 TaxID=3349631 RepID=UPI0036D34665
MDKGLTEERASDAPYSWGECPQRIFDEICSRPRPGGHVITFANEKGGVGKSTLAFNTAVALANAGASVAAIDLDARQGSLSKALEQRAATARCLSAPIACPAAAKVEKNGAAQILQEIARIGASADFVVLDTAGSDTPLGRRAVALADTLVTPINASDFDLDLLGRFDPVDRRLIEPGPFARTVVDLAAERESRMGARPDWVVVKNRNRSKERHQQSRIDATLAELVRAYGIRVAASMAERVTYRELLHFGLTQGDLARIPQLARHRKRDHGTELERFLAELRLPTRVVASEQKPQRKPLHPPTLRERYLQGLRADAGCRDLTPELAD